MRKNSWLREELLHLRSLSGNLTGLCITGVTLLHSFAATVGPVNTITDDMLAVAALLFLICTYVIFIALRTQNRKLRQSLEWFIDPLFALALTIMVATGFIMVYTIW
jgi:hypothetical protein